MKADFEKGTKICSKCKRELPIEMFSKNKRKSDGINCWCKQCLNNSVKKWGQKKVDTFSGKTKVQRGCSTILKRDYELSKEQLKKRERNRREKGHKSKRANAHGVLIWYDGQLNNLDKREYKKIMDREYFRQRRCAVRGYVGKTKPSEHFLFDFDLEQMLKSNVYENVGNEKRYITKWWDGEIRHWTVNDGIWKK